MKRVTKVLGVIVLAALVGFFVTACDNPAGPSGPGHTGMLGLTFAPVDGGFAVTGFNGEEREIVIPDVFNGQPVISIHQFAFLGRQLTTVTIP